MHVQSGADARPPRPTLYNALDRGCSRRTTARHRVVVDLRTAPKGPRESRSDQRRPTRSWPARLAHPLRFPLEVGRVDDDGEVGAVCIDDVEFVGRVRELIGRRIQPEHDLVAARRPGGRDGEAPFGVLEETLEIRRVGPHGPERALRLAPRARNENRGSIRRPADRRPDFHPWWRQPPHACAVDGDDPRRADALRAAFAEEREAFAIRREVAGDVGDRWVGQALQVPAVSRADVDAVAAVILRVPALKRDLTSVRRPCAWTEVQRAVGKTDLLVLRPVRRDGRRRDAVTSRGSGEEDTRPVAGDAWAAVDAVVGQPTLARAVGACIEDRLVPVLPASACEDDVAAEGG